MSRSGIFLALVLIGCLFVISKAIEEDNKLVTVTVGIDLGTGFSSIGVYMNGHVEIIPNDQGNRNTPSWVAFTDSDTLMGEAAKNQAAVNPERTIFDVKRIIGRKFEDEEVQRHMKRVPYKVVNKDGKPFIQVEIKDGETMVFSPEEISAMILTKMKETAETFLGKKITNVVVAVSPYFNDAQRQATKDACLIAGYNVVTIINETTSAGFAYGLHKEAAEKNILVFDLGHGTFDVNILTVDYGDFEYLATTHTHLGGKDVSDNLFRKTVKKTMEDAGLKKHQIDDIILVGGGSEIPKVQQLLRDYFDGKGPKKSVNPDEAVVIGAAVLGDVMTEEWRYRISIR